MTKLQIAYSDDYLNWLLGRGDGEHVTKPIRAKIATELLQARFKDAVQLIEPEVRDGDREKLETLHDPKYVAQVLDHGVSEQWTNPSLLLGHTAMQMFTGTVRLVENIIAGETHVAFNPQGAKHHAQYAQDEGFCVFNDHAWAALEFKRQGLRPVYIDWDVNAGDGTQNLLQNTDIPTFSIHGHGIYPGHSDTWLRGREGENYLYENREKHFYNYNLKQGQGDEGLRWAVDDIAKKVADYRPDVILLAAGADGHASEVWGLKYTYEGFEYAASVVADLANTYAQGRVLIGGAGGYQPFTHTPIIWETVVGEIYTRVMEHKQGLGVSH